MPSLSFGHDNVCYSTNIYTSQSTTTVPHEPYDWNDSETKTSARQTQCIIESNENIENYQK